MTNSDWWKAAHGTSDAPKPLESDSQITRLDVLWTLRYKQHVCTAEVGMDFASAWIRGRER